MHNKHKTPTNNGKYIKQEIYNNRNIALGRTAVQATGGLKCMLLAPKYSP